MGDYLEIAGTIINLKLMCQTKQCLLDSKLSMKSLTHKNNENSFKL